MPNEPLIHWPDPLIEYLGFAGVFLAAGAIGFHYAVLRALRAAGSAERDLAATLAGRAAGIGLTGALTGAVLVATRLPALAARRHVSLIGLVTTPTVAVQLGLIALALIGFTLAMGRRAPGWPLAAIGVIAGAVRSLFFAQWTRAVNPIHELAAGLWIGTLLLLAFLGLPGVLRSAFPAERRGALAAALVHAFSPLALGAAATLAVFGAITAWTHLKALSALWTTPYGWTLIAKLCVVLGVVSLGAWNWRRQRPRMGTETGAVALRRSALLELALGAVVLAITAVLVSLPSPRG